MEERNTTIDWYNPDDSLSLIKALKKDTSKDDIKYLLDNGASVNETDGKGNTPLMLAASTHFPSDIVQQMIDLKANVNTLDKSGQSPLFFALQNWYNTVTTGTLKVLLQNGATLMSDDVSHFMVAVHFKCDYDVIELLLDYGRNDVNFKSTAGYGCTALVYALMRGVDLDIIALLLDRGASVNIADSKGETPLCTALKYNYEDDIIDLLLSNGADPNTALEHCSRRTPLMVAISTNRSKDIITLLLDHGADVNHRDEDGRTALSFACQFRGRDIIALLLDSGADANLSDGTGMSPLMYAVRFGLPKTALKVLLDFGANINHQDENGNTPLMYAINNQCDENVLLEYTLNNNTRDKDGLPIPMNALSKSCDDVVKFLIEKGADVNKADWNGMTPLMCAVRWSNSKSIIKFLIEKGAAINAKDIYDKTVLQYAIDHFHVDIAKFILQAGADVDVCGHGGLTALSYAVQKCKENTHAVVKLLTQYGSDVNATDEYNRTCLMLAIETTKSVPPNKMSQMFYVLRYIRKGADVSLRDKDGQTAADFAKRCGLFPILKDVIDLSTDKIHSKVQENDDIGSGEVREDVPNIINTDGNKELENAVQHETSISGEEPGNVKCSPNIVDDTATERSKIRETTSTPKESDSDDNTTTKFDVKDKKCEKREGKGTEDTSKSKRDLFDKDDVDTILSFKEVKSFGREYSFSTKSSRLMIKLENTPQTPATKERLKAMLGEKYDFGFAEYKDPNIKLHTSGWSTGFVSDFSKVRGTLGSFVRVRHRGNFVPPDSYFALTCRHVVPDVKIDGAVLVNPEDGRAEILGHLKYVIDLPDSTNPGKYDIAMIEASAEVIKHLHKNQKMRVCELKCLCESIESIGEIVKKVGYTTKETSGLIQGIGNSLEIWVNDRPIRLSNIMKVFGVDENGEPLDSNGGMFFDKGDSGAVAGISNNNNNTDKTVVVAMLFGSGSEEIDVDQQQRRVNMCYGFCLKCAVDEIQSRTNLLFGDIEVMCQSELCQENKMDTS